MIGEKPLTQPEKLSSATKPIYYIRVKNCFMDAMLRNSCKNKSQIGDLWESFAAEIDKRAYNNIKNLSQLLIIARERNVIVSSELAVSLILQYAGYSPSDPKSKQFAADYAENTLRDCYGWPLNACKGVHELILKSKYHLVAEDILNDYNFDSRVFHDLQLARLATDWNSFLENILNLRKEFGYLNTTLFTKYQLFLYQKLANRDKLFCFEHFESKYGWILRRNINQYVGVLLHLIGNGMDISHTSLNKYNDSR